MNSPKRAVTESFVDPSSNSDILIYDGTEYVSYMRPAIKAKRAILYSSWGLGGLTDWATDLQDYNDPPHPAKIWDDVYKPILMPRELAVMDLWYFYLLCIPLVKLNVVSAESSAR